MLRNIKRDSGQRTTYQSHKHQLSHGDLNSFLKMARQYDIYCLNPKGKKKFQTSIDNVFAKGYQKLQQDFAKGGKKLQRFNPGNALFQLDQTEDLGMEDE